MFEIDNILIFLGVFLLYLPPLFFTLIRNILEKYPLWIRFNYNVIYSLILTLLMVGLIPSATWIFVFYFLFFNSFRFFLNKRFFAENFKTGIGPSDSEEDNKKRVDIFLLSVYACFMISVLWEIPVQLTSHQNMDAVLLSGFKVLSIPLFFLLIRERGFKININWISSLAFGLSMSILFTLSLYFFGYTESFVFSVNLNRLLWIPFIIASIPKTIYNVKLQYSSRLKR